MVLLDAILILAVFAVIYFFLVPALKKASEILVDHFKLVSEVKVEEKSAKPAKKAKTASKKKSK